MLDDIEVSAAPRLAALARQLCERPTEAEARQLLADQAVALTGCAAAAYARTVPGSGGRQLTWGGPGELVEPLAALIPAAGEAVVAAVFDRRQPVTVADLADDERWPGYAGTLLQHSPIRSVQAQPIRLADDDLGVLVRYATVPGFFDPEQRRLGTMLADHAAFGLSLLASRHRSENLTIALESSREIGQAMGILMATRKVTADTAFDLLRTASQQGHLKLREVAREVTLTGQLPPSATSGTGTAEAAERTDSAQPTDGLRRLSRRPPTAR